MSSLTSTTLESALQYSGEFFEGLYRTMLRIRMCEESFIPLILNGEVHTPCHLYSGQEAIAVGICAAIEREDYVFGNHRSHGHYLAKGCSLQQLVDEVYCNEAGCSHGRGGSMHLIGPDMCMMGAAPIVAGTISLAMGAGLASSIRGDGRVAVSFFGDGAAGEGVLYECLNFASLKNLPVIFVCENNLYSTHMPIRECRIESYLRDIAVPFRITSYQVDGNDVLAVYETGKKAVEQCRAGRGPVFIECLSYRMRGHVGPDDNIQGTHTDIRPKEEYEAWRQRDPLKLFEKKLLAAALFEPEEFSKFKSETATEVAEAHRLAKSNVRPDEKDLMDHVFK